MSPWVAIAGRELSIYQCCGVAGFASAIATGVVLGLPMTLLLALVTAGLVAFLGLVFLTRALLGRERLVYYHHALAVLGTSALVAGALGHPILHTLDVVTVALGFLLAWGRIGCWLVGCCHGRPHRLGLRYGELHAGEGFPNCLVGVPLVPVQAMESLAVFGLTIANASRLLTESAPPGWALANQLSTYAICRFVLEAVRGDAERPAWRGLSEAQWTSVALGLGVFGAERMAWLPASSWHDAIAVALLGGMAVRFYRQLPLQAQLLAPGHVREVAEAVKDDAPRRGNLGDGRVRTRTTSLGIRLTASTVFDAHGQSRLYTFSGLDGRAARVLSSLVRVLVPLTGPGELFERKPGLFHLIVASEPDQESPLPGGHQVQ